MQNYRTMMKELRLGEIKKKVFVTSHKIFGSAILKNDHLEKNNCAC